MSIISCDKTAIKHIFAKTAWQFLRLLRQDDSPRIAVAMYHSIGGNAGASLSPSVFEEHLRTLLSRFPAILTLDQLSQLPLPIRQWTACLTFDDGFSDNYEFALPILQRYGLKATFFICTGFVDGQEDISARFVHYKGLKAMDWGMVKELAAEGMEIGAHTHSHPLLSSLPAIRQDEEIRKARDILEDKLGLPVRSFAIPFGNRGSYSMETLNIAARYFRNCCTTHFSTNPGSPRHHRDMLIFDRIEPKKTDPINLFESLMMGRYDALRWIQRGRKKL